MMKKILLATALALAVPAPLLCQATGVQAAKGVWNTMTAYIAQAAADMPEADYAYAPTPGVRTFGQLVGHLANAQHMICAMALGEQSQGGRNWEQVTDKAALVAALRASSEVCDRAYQQSDEAALQSGELFGRPTTRLGMLVLNVSHDFEHYGNMVTYLRIKGMVPPSSQGN
jgi:uncharacterized damage-inducible protein DinB